MAISTNPISLPGETWAMTQSRLRGMGATQAAQQKPINLLGSLPTSMSSTVKNQTNTQTTTPSMGVKAVSPTTNVAPPAKTLPSNQIASPKVQTNVSSSISTPPPPPPVQAPTPVTKPVDYSGGSFDQNGNFTPASSQTTTPDTGTKPVYSASNPITYGGLLQQAANVASQPSADYLAQQQQANAYNEALKQSRINEAGGLAANAENPIPLEFQQGRAQVLQNQYAQEQSALGSAYQGASNLQGAANTQQGLQQTGLLGAAAGAAPSVVGYGQTTFNPLTQGFGGGASANGGLDPQTQAKQLSELVNSGQMDYNTALTQMSQYGAAAAPALRNAILAKNPSFNFNLSASSASTQAQGQQLKTATESATKALDTLQTAFNGLGGLTSTNIPFINQMAQGGSMLTGVGRDQTSAFLGALNEARAQVRSVLGSAGINPIDAGAIGDSLLPDNMTPSEIPQKIAAAKTYLQNRVNAYVASGQQPGTTGMQGTQNASTGIYSW